MSRARASFSISMATLAAIAVGLVARDSRGDGNLFDAARAARARQATIELDVKGAKEILDGADIADPLLAIERGRLAIYDGDYDGAVLALSRPDLMRTPEGTELLEIAKGCARATAATVIVRDEERGVVVRLQDDEDAALVPMLVDVASRARELLAKELGVELPKPVRIDLVRDQFTLAAMTGLPEEAAHTTGTVAVAKWGRVTMLTPRATDHGYAWLDSLAHEMTHLAITRGTTDKAPLWLQEGVAKREETRWRDPAPLDDTPSADAIAAIGLDKGLGRPIDQLGPSIAMLPSPEAARVAYAEVTSFIRYWAKEVGEDALPQLLLRIKGASVLDDVGRAISEVSGSDFAAWDKRWRAHLATVSRDVPPDLAPGGSVPSTGEITKRVRLGELLRGRGHYHAAAIEHARAQALIPFEAEVRCFLAASLLDGGERQSAAPFVEHIEDVHSRVGRWWSLHGLLHPDAADPMRPFRLAIELDPLTPEVACEEKAAPELPSDALRAALCEAARRVPR